MRCRLAARSLTCQNADAPSKLRKGLGPSLTFADRGLACFTLFTSPSHGLFYVQPNHLISYYRQLVAQKWPRKSTSTVFPPNRADPSIKSLTCIEVLNIQRSATKAEIKKAYHKVNHTFLRAHFTPKTTRLIHIQGRTRFPPRQGPRRAARRSRRKVQGRLASLRNPQRRTDPRPLR